MALTRTKRKHKQDKPMDAATREAIRQKIAASMARKAAKTRYNCPACGVLITRVGGILLHMDKCCPDLLTADSREQVGPTPTAACAASTASTHHTTRQQQELFFPAA